MQGFILHPIFMTISVKVKVLPMYNELVGGNENLKKANYTISKSL